MHVQLSGRLWEEWRTRHLRCKLDVQAELECAIDLDQMFNLVSWLMALSQCLPLIGVAWPHTVFVLLLVIRSTHTCAQRFDDIQAQQLSHCFTRRIPHLGRSGVVAMCSLTHGGKCNVNGRPEYTGINHQSPVSNLLVCLQCYYCYYY